MKFSEIKTEEFGKVENRQLRSKKKATGAA